MIDFIWYEIDQEDCTLYYCFIHNFGLFMRTPSGVKNNVYKAKHYNFTGNKNRLLRLESEMELVDDSMQNPAWKVYSSNGQNTIKEIFK